MLSTEASKKYTTQKERKDALSLVDTLKKVFPNLKEEEQNLLLHNIEENLIYLQSQDLYRRISKGFQVNTGAALTLAQIQARKKNSNFEYYSIDISEDKKQAATLLQDLQHRVKQGEKGFKILIVQRNSEHWSSALINVSDESEVSVFQFDSTTAVNQYSILDEIPKYFPNSTCFANNEKWQHSMGSCGLFALDVARHLVSVEDNIPEEHNSDFFAYLKENTENFTPRGVNRAKLPIYLARTMQSTTSIQKHYLDEPNDQSYTLNNNNNYNDNEINIFLGKKQEKASESIVKYFELNGKKLINARMESFESIKMLKHNVSFMLALFDMGVSADGVKEILNVFTIDGLLNRSQKMFLSDEKSLLLYYKDLLSDPSQNLPRIINDLIEKRVLLEGAHEYIQEFLQNVIEQSHNKSNVQSGLLVLKSLSLIIGLNASNNLSPHNVSCLERVLLSDDRKIYALLNNKQFSYFCKTIEYLDPGLDFEVLNKIYRTISSSEKGVPKGLLNILNANQFYKISSRDELFEKLFDVKHEVSSDLYILRINVLINAMRKNKIDINSDSFNFFTSLPQIMLSKQKVSDNTFSQYFKLYRLVKNHLQLSKENWDAFEEKMKQNNPEISLGHIENCITLISSGFGMEDICQALDYNENECNSFCRLKQLKKAVGENIELDISNLSFNDKSTSESIDKIVKIALLLLLDDSECKNDWEYVLELCSDKVGKEIVLALINKIKDDSEDINAILNLSYTGQNFVLTAETMLKIINFQQEHIVDGLAFYETLGKMSHHRAKYRDYLKIKERFPNASTQREYEVIIVKNAVDLVMLSISDKISSEEDSINRIIEFITEDKNDSLIKYKYRLLEHAKELSPSLRGFYDKMEESEVDEYRDAQDIVDNIKENFKPKRKLSL